MTATTAPAEPSAAGPRRPVPRMPGAGTRRFAAAGTFVLLGVADIALFGLTARSGDAIFALSLPGAGVQLPAVHVAAAAACFVLGGISVAAGLARGLARLSGRLNRLVIATALVCFLLALLCWSDAANPAGPLNVIGLLQGTLTAAIPLVLGALAGLMGERAGVINIAIEGQLIFGAFAAAAVASAVGVLWFGLIAGSLAGGLLGALLATFAIKYRVDQIVLGVVLNLIAAGLTTYLFNRVMAPYSNTFNSGNFFGTDKIPGLGDIPVIGPIFFDSNVFLYLTYFMIIVVQVALFHSRWGLRVRAVGEHPAAAETVGIKVLWTRYRNVILGGMVAGIGGASLTIGSVGQFQPGMSSGFGYIALAAMIFGRWRPIGAVAAALLFGFSKQLGYVLQLLNVPIDSQVLAMAPYVATIIAVAGLVGKVRAPAADGKPYVKT
ncbi:MAG TPA: ABC transporter permease [Streptosporangiaceae bacterium]|nr:ABC transporter permease [Streptosporangiaceae bacterium]